MLDQNDHFTNNNKEGFGSQSPSDFAPKRFSHRTATFRSSSVASDISKYHFHYSDIPAIVPRYSRQATLKSHTPISIGRRFSELSNGSKKSQTGTSRVLHTIAPAYQYFVQKSQSLPTNNSSVSVISGIGSTGARFLNWIGAEIVQRTLEDGEIAQWLNLVRSRIGGLETFKLALLTDEHLPDVLCELLGLITYVSTTYSKLISQTFSFRNFRIQPSQTAVYPKKRKAEASEIIQTILEHCIGVDFAQEIPSNWHEALVIFVTEFYW
jgi:hypothetical protein